MREKRIENNRLRRQRERRKNLLLFVMAVCCICSFSLSAGSFLSRAEVQNGQKQYKYYASIPVEEGDTLWSIAETHMGPHYKSVEEYIKEIRRINALDGESIRAGGYLIVPYYANE